MCAPPLCALKRSCRSVADGPTALALPTDVEPITHHPPFNSWFTFSSIAPTLGYCFESPLFCSTVLGMPPSLRLSPLIFALTAAGAIVHLPRLPIEAHGFNNIGLWPQTLLKGVRWLKLDFSLCTKESCTVYSTWNTGPGLGNASDCVSDGKDDLCCICLAGDASIRPYIVDPFNTSYDVLAFIADPASRPLLPSGVLSILRAPYARHLPVSFIRSQRRIPTL